MPSFSVPSGCRQAMTDLHTAHTERFSKVVNRLKQMNVNQKEDHRLIGAFMDTHNVLRGAIGRVMKHGDELPDAVKDHLHAAATHADDVHSSLISGNRGAGVGRRSVAGKPVGRPMAGQKVEPQTHLLKVIDDIRQRYPQKPTGPR